MSINGLSHKVNFIENRVEAVLDQLPSADLVILDPPRKGAQEFFKQVEKQSPASILYLSCNPATMARDLRIAIEKGYRLEKTILFDFFPFTPEIETLAILRS